MLPTPDTSHVNYDRVYEPAEDSFLLLDTLSSESEITFLKDRFASSHSPVPIACEIGPGSGVVLAYVAANARAILGRPDLLNLGIDVSEFACKATSTTVDSAVRSVDSKAQYLAAVNADLTTCLRSHSVDVLIFNPPYVPSEDVKSYLEPIASFSDQQQDWHMQSLATDGGIDGMEVTNRLLSQLPRVLSHRGVAYVLLCAQNRPAVVRMHIQSIDSSLKVETVGASGQKAGWEKLQIIRIWR